MKKVPLVSVCIANYNGSDMIVSCIESVLAQDCAFGVEILVHDDASMDDSADIVAANYPNVRLIRSQDNVGFCVANNRLVEAAKGDYVLLLNNDAELFHDSLRVLMDEAVSLDQPAILSLPQYDYRSGELIDRGCLLDPFFNPVPNLNKERQSVAMVIGACLWVPKVIWKRLGGFPEWFGSIGEDLYLCCRARLVGYSIRALPVSGYRHWQGKTFSGNRVNEDRLATTFRRRILSERNKTFVMAITSPTPHLLLVFPLHLVLLMVEGSVLSILKWDIRIWKIIYAPVVTTLWSTRNKIYLLRREIQMSRLISLFDWLGVFVLLPYKITMLFKHGLPKIR